MFIDTLAGSLQDAAIRSWQQTSQVAATHVTSRVTGALLDFFVTSYTGTTTVLLGTPSFLALAKALPTALGSSMRDAGPMVCSWLVLCAQQVLLRGLH